MMTPSVRSFRSLTRTTSSLLNRNAMKSGPRQRDHEFELVLRRQLDALITVVVEFRLRDQTASPEPISIGRSLP